MDLRCKQCGTEYEFDDERIAEGGVTVKCTTCGHVFAVRKPATGTGAPLAEEAGDLAAAVRGADAHGSDRPREWKIRRANGKIFAFKELTTLQKWIVERKVNRDDEISLTGETWKRLGSIGELAPFFQVVDEAQRAAQLTAPTTSTADRGATPAIGIPPIGDSVQERHAPPAPVSPDPARWAEAAPGERTTPFERLRGPSPAFEPGLQEGPSKPAAKPGQPAAAPESPAFDFDSFSFRQSAPENARSAQFEADQELPPARRAQEPAFAKTDPAKSFFQDDEALAAAAGLRRGPSRQLLLILGVVVALLAAYLVYYFGVWRPAQSRSASVSDSGKLSGDRRAQQAPSATEAPAAQPAPQIGTAPKRSDETPTQGGPAAQGRPEDRAPPATGAPVSAPAQRESKPAAAQQGATSGPSQRAPASGSPSEGESESATAKAALKASARQREPTSGVASEGESRSAETAQQESKSVAAERDAKSTGAPREQIAPEQLVPEAKGSAAKATEPNAGEAQRKIARAEPRDFDFYMGQGDQLRERDQPRAALEAYRKAAELEPGRAEPLAGRGLALLDMGQKLQAQVWFQQALKLNPSYGVALIGLAEAYRADGKTSDAIRYYEKYLEVLPDGPEASVARSAIKNLQEPSRE